MKYISISLIIFGIIIILLPEILAYLIGGLFIFIGINWFAIWKFFSKFKQGWKSEHIKFGKYKIYR